jgi:hypothetical protein
MHLLAVIQVTARSICRVAEDSLAYTALCIPHLGQFPPFAAASGARPLIRSSIPPDSAHACTFLTYGELQPCARAPLTMRRRPLHAGGRVRAQKLRAFTRAIKHSSSQREAEHAPVPFATFSRAPTLSIHHYVLHEHGIGGKRSLY